MKIQTSSFWSAAIIAALFALPVQAFTILGKVTHVSDGDTLWIEPFGGGKAFDVRIYGIDAPESCQNYGAHAKQMLARHVLHKTVTLATKARDKYGRVIATINLGNQDVGAWMVRSGHAWSYHSMRNAGPYHQDEMMARQFGRGLWAYADPVEPRQFRARTPCPRFGKR